MADIPFGGGVADYVIRPGDGNTAIFEPGAAVTFWDTRDGGTGTQYTTLADLAGTPITFVPADANGAIPPFRYTGADLPDRGMWADASGGAGPRVWVAARDAGTIITDLLNRMATLEQQVTDIYAQLKTCLRYVIQNSDGTWPVLPDAISADVAAAWLGLYTSAQPPLDDGTHARSGSDILLGPTP